MLEENDIGKMSPYGVSLDKARLNQIDVGERVAAIVHQLVLGVTAALAVLKDPIDALQVNIIIPHTTKLAKIGGV
jgi:hypothetical protein